MWEYQLLSIERHHVITVSAYKNFVQQFIDKYKIESKRFLIEDATVIFKQIA
jgi:hypothetical protein